MATEYDIAVHLGVLKNDEDIRRPRGSLGDRRALHGPRPRGRPHQTDSVFWFPAFVVQGDGPVSLSRSSLQC